MGVLGLTNTPIYTKVILYFSIMELNMLFYFITHTILGMLAANSTLIQKHAKNDVASYPLWVNGPWGPVVVAITAFSALSAPITTLFQWNIGWALLTVGEIILGAFIVGLMPLQLRLILNLISPIVAIVITGALWGFWYI